MRYRIDKSDTIPAYLQLYSQIKKDIVSGIYSFGVKLPSKRLLAEEAGVSVITAEHSYDILCEEGYIEPRERSGYFVVYKKDDFLSVSESVADLNVKSKNLHSHEDVIPFSVLAKTMRKVLLDYGEDILIKSPNHGCYELRAAISSYLARSNGMKVLPEQIIIGSGAEYLYSLIAQLFGSGAVFAIESPSYDKIKKVYTAGGIILEHLKLGNNGIKTGELQKTKAKVLHITPFNSFPSGVSADISKRNEYIKWAEETGGYIVEDDYSSELTVSMKNEDTVFSLSQNGSVIYLNTFSQTIAPSMRVGYMVLPTSLTDEFQNKLGFYSCTVPVFEQYVIADLINNGDFERHVNRMRRRRRKKRDNEE